MRVLMMLVLMLVSGSAWADALKVKVVNPTNKNFHNNDNTQMKKNGAFLPYSPSTTKIKIRHNILNAVEEALAGG